MTSMQGFIQEGVDLPSVNPKFKYSKMALFRSRSDAGAILRRSKSLTEPQMRTRVRSCGDEDAMTTSNSFQGVPGSDLGKTAAGFNKGFPWKAHEWMLLWRPDFFTLCSIDLI